MKAKIITLLICLSFLLQSCENAADNFVDCIFNKRPELPNVTLAEATLDTSYYYEFEAGVKNDPIDNDYYYYFDLSGDIPEGINVSFVGRKVIFEGKSTQTGTFQFRISLEVEHENYDANQELCERYTSQAYTLTVN